MKTLLYLSLILNVALLAAVGWRNVVPESEPPAITTNDAAAARPGLKRTENTRHVDAGFKSAWSQVDDRNLEKFMDNLRAAGCPEETIREIATFRICRQFRERYLAAEAEAARAWNPTRNRTQQEWNETRHLNQELRDEMMGTLESVLGENLNSIASSLLGWPAGGDDPMSVIPAEKRQTIREVVRRYDELNQQLQQEGLISRGQDGDIGTRMRQLEKDKWAEVARLLSPQELEEYRYRNSAAANYVRQNAPEARSEAEFRAMVRLAGELEMVRQSPSLAFVANQDDPNNPTADEYAKQKATFDQRLKELLGEQRLSEAQAAEQARVDAETAQRREQSEQQDRARFAEILAPVGVSAEDANRFMNRIKELTPVLQPKFEAMEKSLTGTPEEKQQQMKAAIRAELQKVATEIFGTQGTAVVDKLMQIDL